MQEWFEFPQAALITFFLNFFIVKKEEDKSYLHILHGPALILSITQTLPRRPPSRVQNVIIISGSKALLSWLIVNPLSSQSACVHSQK